jgi:hypothetical protein
MIHSYVSPTLDEKVVVKQAMEKSMYHVKWNPDSEPVQVHYHPEANHCEAKFVHRMFVNGHERNMGVGAA